jgi:hypothetical protein
MTQQPQRTVTCDRSRLLAASTTWPSLPRWFGSRARSPSDTPAARRRPARGGTWPTCTRPCRRRGGGTTSSLHASATKYPAAGSGLLLAANLAERRSQNTSTRTPPARSSALPPFLLQNGHGLRSTLWLTSPYNGLDGGGAVDANPNA